MKKILSVLAVSVIGFSALTGCNSITKQAKSNYISLDEAKSAALSDAKITADSAIFNETKLDDKNGVAYYEIDFVSNGVEYEYDIDAVTGTVIEQNKKNNNTDTQPDISNVDSSINSASNESTTQNNATANQTLGEVDETKAKQIAINHAGVKESDVSFIRAKLDYDDGIKVYDVEFFVEATLSEYDYEINAQTGEIISFDYDAETDYRFNSNNNNNTTEKTEADIKSIALAKVPGATDKDIRVKKDYDDGKMKYEGKIIYQGMEYDFEIDAYSGAILEWEAESIFD